MTEAPIPAIRVKHPCQDRAQFLERYAERVAAKGVQMPTANLRPVGSRVRLILELRSGEQVVGDAVVEAHVRIRDATGISLRYVRLHESGIVFPLSGVAPPAPRPGAVARPPTAAPPAPRASRPPVAAPRAPPAGAPPEAPSTAAPPPAARVGLTLEDLGPELEPWPVRAEAGTPPEAHDAVPGPTEPAAPLATLDPAPEEATAAPAASARSAPGAGESRRDRRIWVALAAALLVALVAAGSAFLVRHRRQASARAAKAALLAAQAAGPVTATCARASGTVEVQRRGAGEWRALAATEVLRGGDLVRTGPASSARIAFVAGGALELEESATVEIGVAAPAGAKAAPGEGSVAVQRGVVRGVLPSGEGERPLGLVIRASDGSATRLSTAKGGEPAAFRLTRAAGGTEVAITEGTVDVGGGGGGQTLSAGRAIDLPGGGAGRVVELLDFPASVDPGVDARFRWRKGLEIRLAWKKVAKASGYRVQVSRSLSFEAVSNTFEVEGTEISFAPPEQGMFAWRVASRDAAGRYGEYGFARRVYCEREPSRDLLVGPADRETVTYSDERPTVTFTWQSAANAKSYRLVVATSPDLLSRAVVNRVTEEQRLEVKDLAPGTYSWGVFVGDGASPAPIFQKPRSLVIQRVAKGEPKATRRKAKRGR